MHDILRVTWDVTPLNPPLVWRNCPACRTAMPFACTGDFRTNAQKKRIDIWLIYRCTACGARWNLPLFERVLVTDLPPDRFDAIARNDPAIAAQYAFDVGRLSRHSHRIEEASGLAVRKRAQNAIAAGAPMIEISIALARPSRLRLDHLLSQELGIARNRLKAWQQAGALSLVPAPDKALRARIADGQRIHFTLATVDADARLTLQARACG